MTGDSVSARAAWRTGTLIPATPSAVVSLKLDNARVYAYELKPAD